MKTNVKYALWILCVFLIAFVAGRFREPGSVHALQQQHAPVGCGGRGHVCVATPAQPAPGQVVSSTPTVVQPGAPPAKTAPVAIESFSQLLSVIEEQPASITSITITNGLNVVKVSRPGLPDASVVVPDEGGKAALIARAASQKVTVVAREIKVDPVVKFVSDNFVTFLVLGVVIFLFTMGQRGMAKQMGGVKSMGKSRARDADENRDKIKKVTFNDVAGCDEAVKELRRVVKGIVGAEIYQKFQAELPRGILLIGPPGTGKTLLAKAVAGESDGTFDITSGSDFVEMLVGVGASRVRDLFDNARKKVAETGKPHVIFIDEIDAVGGKRGGGTSMGSNSEREQTLNQILVEMDGMVSNEGIIIIAATNRVDMLDDALLRPGRFDCHVSVDLPDRSGREAIFAIHIGDRMLAADVSLGKLAHRTFGYSGAEIKGIVNRASIVAAERYAARLRDLQESGLTQAEIDAQLVPEVTLKDFDEGIDFVRYGNAVPSKQARMSEKDKKNTAYHEAGHAVSAVVFPDSDPVVKITIMRRSKALGYVQYMPETDRVSFSREQAIARIVSAMAGRATQEVFLKTFDTGASNDFQQATDMARKMVTQWGMSRLGNISVGERGEGPFGAGSGGGYAGVGPELSNEIDREWRYIVDTCYRAAVTIVKAESERIEKIAAILLDKETMLVDEWKALLDAVPSRVDLRTLVLPVFQPADVDAANTVTSVASVQSGDASSTQVS